MIYLKTLMFSLIVSAILPMQSLSSSEPANPMLPIPPERYLETNGDKMKFKDLMAYAQVNQAQKQAVVQYFQHRFNKLKNTQCPVLSAAWLKENSGREFPQGYPSVFEPSRLPPIFRDGRVAHINDLNWRILTTSFITHTPERKVPYYGDWALGRVTSRFDVTHNPNVTDLHSYSEFVNLVKPEPSNNVGIVAQKMCKYDLDQNPNEQDPKLRYRFITLTIYDEFPKLDGIDFSVK